MEHQNISPAETKLLKFSLEAAVIAGIAMVDLWMSPSMYNTAMKQINYVERLQGKEAAIPLAHTFAEDSHPLSYVITGSKDAGLDYLIKNKEN